MQLTAILRKTIFAADAFIGLLRCLSLTRKEGQSST
jgi:hypothetical protein